MNCIRRMLTKAPWSRLALSLALANSSQHVAIKCKV